MYTSASTLLLNNTEFPSEKVPASIVKLLNRLWDAGYPAQIVGGCVRDCLLGSTPHDWDITTAARPEEIKACFASYPQADTGIRHGTVSIFAENRRIEMTTYRLEGVYSDHRRPETVCYTSSLERDLERRDFTVNAMAWSPQEGLTDPFNGRECLKSGILKCVGNPQKRFDEDALRILRGVRFVSQLGFSLEKATRKALNGLKENLRYVSAERLTAELLRLLEGKNVRRALLEHWPVLCVFLPEIQACVGFEQHTPYHIYDVWEHTAYAVEACPPDPEIRLAMLLHDIAKPVCFRQDTTGRGHFPGHEARSAEMADCILRRMKVSSRLRKRVCLLIRRHHFHCDFHANADQENGASFRPVFRGLLAEIGMENCQALFAMQRADTLAKADFCRERLPLFEGYASVVLDIAASGDCISVRQLAVNGADLQEAGLRGSDIGKTLQWLLEQVIQDKLENQWDQLMRAVFRTMTQDNKK